MTTNDHPPQVETSLPDPGPVSGEEWDDYEAVNDPRSGKRLPNEGHAGDDDWDDYEVVNDPASGKRLPNEGHAADDDWDDYEAVNDPASGRRLPNEGHAGGDDWENICVTETFVRNIHDIYGTFRADDDEYPAMGITIQGAPVFVECVRFPDCAVLRRRASDEVQREHPAVASLWRDKLCQYEGKCRTSTVHIHPMNLGSLSAVDIGNFDSLRQNPDDPSTFPTFRPYPVILVNLSARGELEILGFWVDDGRAHATEVQHIADDDALLAKAWESAERVPYFSAEGEMVRRIERRVSKQWTVELGVHARTAARAIKAIRDDGTRVLVRFDRDMPLGLSAGRHVRSDFRFENYVDWTRMFDDLAVQDEAKR